MRVYIMFALICVGARTRTRVKQLQPDRVGLLSVEQSLADFAAIIHHLRDSYKAWGCPLMSFGGSLAGQF